jgi:hypothetical protein
MLSIGEQREQPIHIEWAVFVVGKLFVCVCFPLHGLRWAG